MSKRKFPTKQSESSQVVIHFDGPGTSSQKIISQAKKLGIDLGMTPKELDAIRARGPELQKWLSADPSHRQDFVRDPHGTLAALEGAPIRRKRSYSPISDVRWRGLKGTASTEIAGAIVGEWALREPDRLALLIEDPQAAIEAALIKDSKQTRAQLLKEVSYSKKAKSLKKSGKRRA